MKRFAPAIVAAATALTLVATPGTGTAAPTTAPSTTATTTPATTAPTSPSKPTDTTKPTTPAPTTTSKPGDNGDKKPSTGSSFSIGLLVGIVTALGAALSTTALIVFSNPTGINKIADMLKANGVPVPPLPRF